MIEPSHNWNTSFKPVIWGFILSIVFTLVTYFIVVENLILGWKLITILMGFTITQGISQLICYLHLGIELKPRWNLMLFCFMCFLMVIILTGTIWIMDNLSYHLVPHLVRV
ncbi:MAG: cytochrome C oxidase subunit IV family protein [Chlamydiales bacterium]